jgi:REP element-mobilizing transposase RayT
MSRKLAALGDVHFGRKRVQPRRGEVCEFYANAEPLLVHPVIRFNELQRAVIGEALGDAMRTTPYTCWACAVMPDHVHVVIRKHRDRAEEMIERLQDATRDGLIRKRLVPADHPVWTVNGWKVFLDSPEGVGTRVAYVEGNPHQEGLARQEWGVVTA